MPVDFPFKPGIKPCPICGTEDKVQAILVPISGTEEDNIVQAIQVHIKCIADNLVYYPDQQIMAIQLMK